MPHTLLLRLPAPGEEETEWLSIEDSRGPSAARQRGPLSLAAAVARSARVVALAPASHILLAEPEMPPGSGDELRLDEDLHLDSLGRVQLAAALEERLGLPPQSGLVEAARTLGELRRLLRGDEETARVPAFSARNGGADPAAGGQAEERTVGLTGGTVPEIPAAWESTPAKFIYPRWPWLWPFRMLRAGFVEAVARPLVWLLADPRVVAPAMTADGEPMLIVANHVTTYDGPLVLYALPGAMRRRVAVAMSGEMLEDFRHFRNPEHGPRYGRFDPFGPFAYLLLTALFNVFPLARQRGFQSSFEHAGAALDRGFNVLVFPEGTRSAEGKVARFRPGIGLLAKQSGAPVLPVALRGLGELKKRGRGWFRSGAIEVRVGEPIRFSATESEAGIAARLQAAVEGLLGDDDSGPSIA